MADTLCGLSGILSQSKGSPYSTTERRVPELIPVLGSQTAADVSHKPGGRLPLLSARPAVTPATLKRAATNFAAWWTEAEWVWAVCLILLQRRDCDLNQRLSAPESSTLTTRLPSHPLSRSTSFKLIRRRLCSASSIGCLRNTAHICCWTLSRAIDRYLMSAERSAVYPPLLLSIDGTDRRTDGQCQ